MATKIKRAPVVHLCPACDQGFTASERRSAKGGCPSCGIELTHKRERNESGKGFRHTYVIANKEDQILLIGIDGKYDVVSQTGGWPNVITSELKSEFLEENLPTYRIIFEPTPMNVNCYCPRCGGYLFQSSTIKTGGSRGTIMRCKNKPGGEIKGQCKIETEFVFR